LPHTAAIRLLNVRSTVEWVSSCENIIPGARGNLSVKAMFRQSQTR